MILKTSAPQSNHKRRGVSVLLAMWSVVIAALTATSIQLVSFRQAHLGHEVLQRTQARWSARAGVESVIAALAWDATTPEPNDAFSVCLLYTSPSPRDRTRSRMPSSA